jgi:hypothetical protein
VESIRSFFDAAGTFLDHLSEVNVGALLIALALHCGNLLLRAKAWHAIISAAFPRDRISKRMVLGAYVLGQVPGGSQSVNVSYGKAWTQPVVKK